MKVILKIPYIPTMREFASMEQIKAEDYIKLVGNDFLKYRDCMEDYVDNFSNYGSGLKGRIRYVSQENNESGNVEDTYGIFEIPVKVYDSELIPAGMYDIHTMLANGDMGILVFDFNFLSDLILEKEHLEAIEDINYWVMNSMSINKAKDLTDYEKLMGLPERDLIISTDKFDFILCKTKVVQGYGDGKIALLINKLKQI